MYEGIPLPKLAHKVWMLEQEIARPNDTLERVCSSCAVENDKSTDTAGATKQHEDAARQLF